MCSKEDVIAEHLSSEHPGFEEFQCLKCDAGFKNVHSIRVHMSIAHPANYLLIGARYTSKLVDSAAATTAVVADEIQVVYVGNSRFPPVYKLIYCSAPNALNGMNPMELISNEQHETLKSLNVQYQNMKTVFTGQIPEIRNMENASEIISYENYKTLKPLTIQYKCITDEIVNEVNAIATYIDRSNDIDSKCCNINVIDDGNVSSMIIHRLEVHIGKPISFLQIEQQYQIRVNKIVRCKIQCVICNAQFTTRPKLIHHFYNDHPNCWFAGEISVNTQVIDSSDPKYLTQLQQTQSSSSFDYFYCSNLICIQPNGDRINVGTRTQAINHYNESHDSIDRLTEFEVRLFERVFKNNAQEIAIYKREIREPHQMYLFECQHCKRLFESLAGIEQHFADVRLENANIEHSQLRFLAKKLFRCHKDELIQTFNGMKRHYDNHHPGEPCTPVNVLLPSLYCGLCGFRYNKKINDLKSHYAEIHAGVGEMYNDGFLKSIDLDGIHINQCKYISECCFDQEDQIDQIVAHTLKCHRRFSCSQYPDNEFSSIESFLLHRMEHDPDTDCTQIISDLQCFKTFMMLLSNMKIIWPNGFIATLTEIVGTAFANELRLRIGKIVHEAWNREKQNLSTILMVNDGKIGSFMIFAIEIIKLPFKIDFL